MKVIVNNILLNHVESGHPHGIPVVFIHGFPFTNSMWAPQVEGLPSSYRLITYDVRGLGKSDLGTGMVSIDLHADDLIGLLEDLEIEKAIICGLSMGGYIALKAIEKYPDKFMGLILCDTKSESDTEEARQKRYEATALIKQDGVAAFAEGFLKNVLAPNTPVENGSLVKLLLNQIAENSSEGLISAQLAMASRSDTTSNLKNITVPTLIIVGEEDKLIPVEMAQNLLDKIPGARLEVITKAGHMSNLENPQAFNKVVTDFLSSFNK